MTEKTEGMEKYGVVKTEKEKTAHEQIKKEFEGTKSGRIPTNKPNKVDPPKEEK